MTGAVHPVPVMAEPLLNRPVSPDLSGGFMRRSLTLGLVLGAAFVTNIAPAYAQRWGREATPRAGVCFYENIKYGGESLYSPLRGTMVLVPLPSYLPGSSGLLVCN